MEEQKEKFPLKFKQYSETSMARDMEEMNGNKTKSIGEILMSMNGPDIEDYSQIPMSTYTNWKLLIEINDKQGPYNNMLVFEKRQEILLKIHKWEETNLGNIC